MPTKAGSWCVASLQSATGHAQKHDAVAPVGVPQTRSVRHHIDDLSIFSLVQGEEPNIL